MLSRPKLLIPMAVAWLTISPALTQGAIFTDGDFLAANYTASTSGVFNGTGTITTDIRYNIDYSNIDIFGDGFLTAAVPPSPRGSGTTTGVFLSANNNSFNAGKAALAAITPNGVNVGTGTANPNYVMRVDVFNSVGNGIDNGSGTITGNNQLTTYSYVGLNQSNTTVQVRNFNPPAATGSQPGQGLGLLMTGDGDAGDDFWPLYGGAVYVDRSLTDIAGQAYSQQTKADIHTGLLGMHLNDYWKTQGFEFNVVTPAVDDNLFRATGNGIFYAPDPTNVAGFLSNGNGVDKSPYLDAFPKHSDPLHLSGGGVVSPAFLAPNITPPYNANAGAVPYNKWATHELYWVDGTFTYVITYNGVTIPMLQITPDDDGLNGDDNILSAFSKAGAPVLGFWDRFDSIALGPDGGNFTLYDNLEIEVANAGDVPDMMDYLVDNGYTIAVGVDGDFDGDDDVDGRDFLAWQRGESPTPFSADDLAEWQGAYNGGALAAVTVPEPASLLLLVSMAGCGLFSRRRG